MTAFSCLIASRYLEDNGQGRALVSPWVWIVGMSIGPLLASVSLQWYSYYATIILYRVEALLVELILEHSLRIRLQAEVDDSKNDAGSSAKPTTSPLVGKINTLITVDISNVGEARDFLILGKSRLPLSIYPLT